MTSLVDKLAPDDLWAVVEPLLPSPPRPPYGGRCRTIPDRNCLSAIVFMARTSTPWHLLPAKEFGCGRHPPPGAGWTSGPRPACLIDSTWRFSTGWAWPAGSTGPRQVWTPLSLRFNPVGALG